MFERMFPKMCAAAVPCVVLSAVLIVTGCAPEAEAENRENAEHTVLADGGTGDATLAAAIADAPTIKVYKSPTCGCCALWVDHMREAGFELDVEDTLDMVGVKLDAGLPLQLQSCHTALVGDYVFEGHIPADVIARFLAEAPSARGLAVPGMPIGSPGMEFGDRVDPYDVIQFDAEGSTSVYESR
ncbi:DUF411 domain-containing protein [Candidatus Palauibacter sp.]|uniref:DUF411 domain-containing protein n=1 Tax=Candidatus Palauibacter sp. TaxID=3101350 RepID=UPI003B5B6723